MHFSVILVLALALHVKGSSKKVTTTDGEETFVANAVKKKIGDLEDGRMEELKPETFEAEIREVFSRPEMTTKLTSLVNKAREPAWMRDRLIQGTTPMVSSTLANEIKDKLGDISIASAELRKFAEFNERYNSAEQYVLEILTRRFSDIETSIVAQTRGEVPAHGTENV